ncbi:sigma-54-dependent Fis family transcriptional regulator [Pandoraea anapnoica]|uniref:Sigma-54-dependent Fis family transcriptional regulator n=1 Tax=Pandoraea anapnoica TaxID=2508301 RepID=A0A5E5AKK1_9BURK|nr:sigma 54-interacting transcriptional regulator [Pandoraea anapnoica]VVE73125.1 sigma-54-dependent Fis family transcriptional regulator [Pandoraea anapnoica]
MPAHLAVASAPARPVGHAAPLGAASAHSANTAFNNIAALAERVVRVPAASAPAPASRQLRPDYLAIDDLCGTDARMRDLLARGKRFVDRGLPVLILGETGTGKEFLARALHEYSERRRQSFVAINTASLPEHLIESELFGYQRGAFSGALPGGMKGKMQQADGGTLFLDEIGDMPYAMQTRLLRVLSEREVTPLGASQPVPVDVQLICATHQDLASAVAQGTFREDLYYRIAVGVLTLPTLRERDDKRELIARMLCDEWPGVPIDNADQALARVTSEALACLLTHAWPGNLRQMRAALRYACAVMSGELLCVDDLPPELASSPASHSTYSANRHEAPRDVRIEETAYAASIASHTQYRAHDASHEPHDQERERILQALAQHRWNISAAARTLGFCRASLYRKLKQLSIPHVRDCGEALSTRHYA